MAVSLHVRLGPFGSTAMNQAQMHCKAYFACACAYAGAGAVPALSLKSWRPARCIEPGTGTKHWHVVTPASA